MRTHPFVADRKQKKPVQKEKDKDRTEESGLRYPHIFYAGPQYTGSSFDIPDIEEFVQRHFSALELKLLFLHFGFGIPIAIAGDTNQLALSLVEKLDEKGWLIELVKIMRFPGREIEAREPESRTIPASDWEVDSLRQFTLFDMDQMHDFMLNNAARFMDPALLQNPANNWQRIDYTWMVCLVRLLPPKQRTEENLAVIGKFYPQLLDFVGMTDEAIDWKVNRSPDHCGVSEMKRYMKTVQWIYTYSVGRN